MSDTTSDPRPPDLTRRTLTPFGYAVCVVVPLLIAALGFTALHFHYNKEQLVSGTTLHILTSDWKPGDDAMTASVTGHLVLSSAGCLQLESQEGGTVDLVWPADYEATVQNVGGTDQIKVYDPDRNIVARSAQSIELGGGTADAGAYAGEACAPTSGQLFAVQSSPQVVGP